jgi:methylmalonyl-CoA/ethylmalonyl-CoA epimerase
MIRRLDHVAVLVGDTEAALAHFRDHLGLKVVAVDEPPEVPVRLTYLDLGNAWLQLVEPLDPDHPVARWQREHGDGLHHICFGVDDVEAELARIGDPSLPVPPLGSGRGRPAGFTAGDPPHGVRIECTLFDAATDLGAGVLTTDLGAGVLTNDQEGSHVSTPRELSEAYWAAECRRDLDAVMTYYHDDAVYEGPDGANRGHDEIRRSYEQHMAAYPGLEVEIVRDFPAGDWSAIEFDATVIDHDGTRSRVRGVNVVHVRDGKFTSVRSYEDPPNPA